MPNQSSHPSNTDTLAGPTRPKRRATAVVRPVVNNGEESIAIDPILPAILSFEVGRGTPPNHRTPTSISQPVHMLGKVRAVIDDPGDGTEHVNKTGASASERAAALPKRDLVHRLRTSRNPEAKYLGNHHSKVLVDLLGVFGVIDLRTAVALSECIGGASQRYYTMRVAALQRVGVLRRDKSSDLRLGRLLGRSYLLVPDASWGLAVEAFGADGVTGEWSDATRTAFVERLALVHLILERVLSGWKLVRGADWIMGLSELDRSKTLGARTRSVTEALRDGLVRFENPASVWGLLPPTADQNPALLVGRGAISMKHLSSVLTTARRVAPVEVICYHRSSKRVEHVRRIVMKKLGGVGDSHVNVLPSASGFRWARSRRELLKQIEGRLDPAVRASLIAMLASAAPPKPGSALAS